MSTTITADIDVDVPVRTAYDQWTQFESFPEFLSGVDEVTQIDDALTHWIVSLGGVRREFDARIVDQVPDGHVAWRSVGEVMHHGRVAFRPESGERTHVELSMEWEPEGLAEKAGAALQLDDMLVKRDLQRFKEFIEEREVPSGAWRGEVHGGTPGADERRSAEASMGASSVPQPQSDGTLGADPDLRA
jgi:uncharacterized membrane protein